MNDIPENHLETAIDALRSAHALILELMGDVDRLHEKLRAERVYSARLYEELCDRSQRWCAAIDSLSKRG